MGLAFPGCVDALWRFFGLAPRFLISAITAFTDVHGVVHQGIIA
jgi:hypothetical protein